MTDDPSQTTSTTQPLANSAEARSTDGTILDQGTAPTAPAPATTEAPSPVAGAPESYELGEGLDPKLSESATAMFKDLNLPQAGAKKLVDFYNTQMKGVMEQSRKAYDDMRADWRDKVKADPELGPNLESKVLPAIGRLKATLSEADRNAFSEVMNLTGAGDHPAVIKALYKMAQSVGEGTHVSGHGPSTEGQTAPGKSTRPSIAGALYPNLPQ